MSKRGDWPYTREVVAAYFKAQGCELLSPKYHDKAQVLAYRCKDGKVRQSCFANFVATTIKEKQQQEGQKSRIYRRTSRAERTMRRGNLLTMQDMVDRLGVHYMPFRNAVVRKQLPAPHYSVPGKIRKYYLESDVKLISQMIEVV